MEPVMSQPPWPPPPGQPSGPGHPPAYPPSGYQQPGNYPQQPGYPPPSDSPQPGSYPQQPGYPPPSAQPGYGYPGAPAPKGRSGGKIALIAGIAVVVLVAAGFGVAALFKLGSSCPPGGETIKPPGGAYTYRVPPCWAQQTKFTTEHKTGQFEDETLISPEGKGDATTKDLIKVSAHTLDRSADDVSDADILTELQGLPEQLGATVSGEPEQKSIAGGRAWRFDLKIEGTSTHTWWIFKGEKQIQVTCQWASESMRPAVETGCTQVLESFAFGT
jgi:hypothetical protein